MALQIVVANDIGAGTQRDLTTADDLFVASGVVVGTTDNNTTIVGTGSFHQLDIHGTILSLHHAIEIGTTASFGNTLLVSEGAYIGATLAPMNTSGPATVRIFGDAALIDNRGTIRGFSEALQVGGDGLSSEINIFNSGLIEATSFGVGAFGDCPVNFVNTGEVRTYHPNGSAYTAAFDSFTSQVTNSGLMTGDVNFGFGDDLYDGRGGGRVVGQVEGSNGIDQMFGGAFSDSFFGEAGNDTLDGGAGDDLLDGGNDNDVLTGGAGNDTLTGGLGADTMLGGAGNDIYSVDNPGDIVNEAGGSGIDLVQSSISFSLANPARAIGAVENLTLTGAAAINGTGNALANKITGNTGNNTLDGGLGNDTLLGGAGNDILIGNAGKDMHTGGANNDIFRFLNKAHSVVGANADVISDFDDFGNDTIDVSALFGPKMIYRHNGAFTGAGQLRITDIAGPDLLVQVNTGGSLAADFAIRLAGTTLGSMTASDFIL